MDQGPPHKTRYTETNRRESQEKPQILSTGEKFLKEINMEEKVWMRDGRKGHSETAPHGDPSHRHSPNPDTIVDAKMCMLTGA